MMSSAKTDMNEGRVMRDVTEGRMYVIVSYEAVMLGVCERCQLPRGTFFWFTASLAMSKTRKSGCLGMLVGPQDSAGRL